MALVLVDTAGAANANTYASLATAEAYMASRPFVTAWTAVTDDEMKKQALLFATSLLDRLKWAGAKPTATQALSFPRRWVPTLEADAQPDVIATDFVDQTVLYEDDDTIPPCIVKATCELALELIGAGATDPYVADKSRVKTKTVGPLSTTYFDSQDTVRGLGRFPHVMQIINHALRGTSTELERA